MARSMWATGGRPTGLTTTPLAGIPATRSHPPVGWATLIPEDLPELAVLCELGDDVPDPDQGYGGWATTPKQRDKALVDWAGIDPMGIELDLVLDGYLGGGPVDDLIDNLEAFAGRGRKRLPGEPPKIVVDTAGLFRHDATVFPSVRWVVNDLQWDAEQAITDTRGRRLRAGCTVTLLEFNTASRLQDRALRNRLKHQAAHGNASKTYTLKTGETLVTVARKKLGDAGRWPEIARINGIRDPLSVKAGAQVRLP